MKMVLVLLAVSIAGLRAQVQPFRGPPPPQQDQTGKASIEGAVVDALTHEPVLKASVMLNGRVSLTALTDASGHFAFRQLPAGQYSVQAQSARYPVERLRVDLARQTSVTVAGEEQKRDVTLSLTPGASVRGRILDEEGTPMPQCTVRVMQKNMIDNGMGLVNTGGFGQSDENGEYRIVNLPAGKYYLMANCPQSIPLPHAFVRRDSAANLPRLAYHNVFYPGTADPTSAARVEAQPGGLVAGIDFRMAPATGVTVRGRARPSSLEGNLQAILQPSDPLRRQLGQQGAGFNPRTGEFQFANVAPGSYELVGWGTAGKQSYFARVPVEVGASPPDPVELLLSPGVQISGTLVIEADDKQPPNPNPVRIMLNPLGSQMFFGPSPQAEVNTDGTFVFDSVIPARWRVQVGGPGYVKSLALGNKEVSGDEIEITAGASPLKIVMSTKYVEIALSVSSPPAGNGPLSGVAWGATSQSQQGFGFDSQGVAHLRLPPGQYHVCACMTAQQPMLFQNRELRKSLESHCKTVDVSEGGPQKVQISAIPSEELKRVIDSLDE